MEEPSPNGPKKDASSLSVRLLRYVVATSYAKITRRLKHKTLSQPYIRSLKTVDTFNVVESELEQPTRQGTENDRLFLIKFFSTTPPEFQIRFPKLVERANKVADENFRLYTKDTCAEFHSLFILLLVRFEEHLEVLGKTRGDGKVPTPCSKEFNIAVESVIKSGYALQRLAHGAALRMHLQTIGPSMRSNYLSKTEMPMPVAEEQEEFDVDLKAVQPFVNVNGAAESRLWKSYIDWLRLIMVHFDAVEILVNYFTGPSCPRDAISIHILVPPYVDKRLLPWRELFNDSTLFPTKTTWDPLSVPASGNITNAGILQFLNNALGNASDSHTRASAVIASWAKRDLVLTIKNLENLKSSKLPGWKESATRLLDMLKELQDMPELGSELDLDISNDIAAISQSGRFFSTLASIKPEQDFRGALHCEACLASLLRQTANVSEGLVAQMKVGYFSISFLSPESHFL